MQVKYVSGILIALFFTIFIIMPVAAKEIQTGLYGLTVSGNFADALKSAKLNGFTLTVTNAEKAHLDLVRTNGMKSLVAFWLTKDITRDEAKWQEFQSKLRVKIAELKGHPALYAWYLADEPDGQGIAIDRLKTARTLIKSLDPGTPIFTVLDNPKKWYEYLPYFDIIAVDPYMRKNLLTGYDPPEVVRDWLKKVKADQKKLKLNKPVWVVLGGFDTRPRATGVTSNYKKPTPAEFRSMVEMSLAEGVEGILVYTYAFTESDRYLGWKLPQDDPSLWEEIRRLPAKANP